MEPLAGNIGQREVRHKKISCSPRGGTLDVQRRRGECRTEDGELVAETAPATRLQVAGEIPPFGSKTAVRPVIVGEREIAHPYGALEAKLGLTPQHVCDLQPGRRWSRGRGRAGDAGDRGKGRQQTAPSPHISKPFSAPSRGGALSHAG